MKHAGNNGKHRTIFPALWCLLIFSQLPQQLLSSDLYPKSDGKWVIVIDAGHGGSDPGALGSVSKEKDINLAIALKTGYYLKENIKNVTVIYTRENDKSVDLLDRPKIANKNNADLFISIHANWASSKNVSGAETFIMGHTKDQANLEVAMKENEVILLEDDYSAKYQNFDPKSPESYIIFTLMQNVYQKQSTELAAMVQKQFSERVSRKDRGVKQAGFWVLYNTTMPSILIETGFITNPAEEKFLASKNGQDFMASAIFRAIRDYLNEIELKSGIKVDTQAAVNSIENKPAVVSAAPIDTPGEGATFFTVQVGSSARQTTIKPENFKGIRDIREIKSGSRYRYISGSFREYSDATVYRKNIEKLYPDAFVIAIKDNKIVPLQEALGKTVK